MVERAEALISEIKQIKLQYVKEVGERKRRTWPRSIKERVAELDHMGLPARTIADDTGIPYETVVVWRHARRKAGGGFHELAVGRRGQRLPAISKSGAVTVPNRRMLLAMAGGVPESVSRRLMNLRFPGGFVVEGVDEAGVVSLLRQFSSDGSYAS